MAETKATDVIDIRSLSKKIWIRRKLFYKVLPTVFVLSCLYIICIPRTYTTSCKLAPELNSSSGGSTLGTIANSLGFDLSEMETSDAITPMLYPDLMEDNRFVVNLFPIIVSKADGSLQTTYYDYLKKHQQRPWWAYCTSWLKGLLKSEKNSGSEDVKAEPSPYILSEDDNNLANTIRGNIQLSIDKKTGVISISVLDQDPLICKTLADSVSVHLQQFITDYRTNKARTDLEFYRKLTKDAKQEYDSLRRMYNILVDANKDVVLQRYKSKQDDIESEMGLKYNAYTSLNAMLQQSVNKVQERTPVFTVLKGAEMPLKAAKPKRMIFVIAMVFFAAVVTAGYVLKGTLWNI
ncbi:MAG: chain-length determining protein [Prevotella sp.]|nr:chain-length determining protein [Prevotella sp.]